MRYFSTFTGIGGFELGIQLAYENTRMVVSQGQVDTVPSGQEEKHRAGVGDTYTPRSSVRTDTDKPTCVGYSEIDKYATKVYQKHFPEHKNYGDATTINAKELPDFDLLVGGFPCQAFSIAGKRAGFNDTRGTLFFDIARILAEKRPRHLVLENVKGLLSHDSGKTFQTILGVLADLGYRVEWQVLNSKDFGVPQNRERVYFIGHLRGECSGQVLPLTASSGTHIKYDVKGSQRFRVYNPSGLAPTIPTMQGGNTEPKIFAAPVLTPDRVEKRQNGRRMKDNGEPAFTVTAQDRHGLYDGARIRRLTPKECERLQGFPDDWTQYGVGDEVISDTQRYKMCGNAVTVNVIRDICERLLR